jgi:hypothetical protein
MMREKQRSVVMLDELRRRASERDWRGKGGLTDRDVYLSLIEVAQDHGSVCDDGMRISISVRELSRRARISYASTLRSLNNRLVPAGLVTRSAGGWGQTSGSLILLIDDDALDSRGRTTADVNNSKGPTTKFSGLVIETLHASGTSTRPEIAKVLGRKSREIKSILNRLVASGLVERAGDTYSLPANFETILEERFLSDGTIETDRKHKELFEKEREAYARQVGGGIRAEPRT